MSLTKSELLENKQYELTFGVDKAAFDAAVDKAYHKNVGKISIPGFRRGKAPRAIIEKMYGKGAFYDDAINDLLPEAFEAALKEFDKTVVGRPEFDVETIDENGVVFKAKVYVKPEVKIDGYKGLKLNRVVAPVKDEDIEDELKRVQERNARMTDITDRAAALGDTSNIDFEGFIDGKPFEGGKGEGFSLVLGSGQFIPGFEEQIVGHAIGDKFDVNVTFPADYSAEEFQGKAATFKCKLNGLKLKELPAIDDELARDVSEFDTLDAYKADIKKGLEEKNAQAADNEVDSQLLQALVDKLEADIPECMFETEVDNIVRDYDNRFRMQGMDLETYFKYTGLTMESLRMQARPQAENQVKTRLALEKISELEKIEVSEEDINAEYESIAKAYNMKLEDVKAAAPADAIAEDMKVKKAVDFVKANATISDKKPAAKKASTKAQAPKEEASDAEKPAKKTTAKKTTAKKEASGETKPAKKTTKKKADAE